MAGRLPRARRTTNAITTIDREPDREHGLAHDLDRFVRSGGQGPGQRRERRGKRLDHGGDQSGDPVESDRGERRTGAPTDTRRQRARPESAHPERDAHGRAGSAPRRRLPTMNASPTSTKETDDQRAAGRRSGRRDGRRARARAGRRDPPPAKAIVCRSNGHSKGSQAAPRNASRTESRSATRVPTRRRIEFEEEADAEQDREHLEHPEGEVVRCRTRRTSPRR